jgi:uncharacterized membrane protein
MSFLDAVGVSAQGLEGAGVLAMFLGAALAVVRAGVQIRKKNVDAAYAALRLDLGRAILLGLEFLVAADIVRTVVEVPSLVNVTVLGIIVLIRTFLSFTLQVDLEGHWPWQRHGKAPQSSGSGGRV